MKKEYYNEENDCDRCKHHVLAGRDDDRLDCWRRKLELSYKFEERDIRVCSVCNNEFDREEMDFTKDCYGIEFRLVCRRCGQKLMSKGYDGEYYTQLDEQIEDDY